MRAATGSENFNRIVNIQTDFNNCVVFHFFNARVENFRTYPVSLRETNTTRTTPVITTIFQFYNLIKIININLICM